MLLDLVFFTVGVVRKTQVLTCVWSFAPSENPDLDFYVLIKKCTHFCTFNVLQFSQITPVCAVSVGFHPNPSNFSI